MRSTFVSVVIPAYNKAATLEKALVSVLNQTHKNLEIIVIDDCSTDETYSICRKYIKEILYIRNEENVGCYSTRLKAIDDARGEYLLFVDADDWLSHDAIEHCIITAINYPADIVQMNVKRRITKFNLATSINSEYNTKKVLEACLYNEHLFPVSCWGKLYTRQILQEAAYIDFDSFWGEDRIFNIPVFELKPRIAVNNKATYNYRWGGESLNHFNENAINDYVAVYDTKSDWAKKHGYIQYLPMMQEELKRLLLYHIRHMIDTEKYSAEEIITFLNYELSNSPRTELGDMKSAEEIYTLCNKSFKRKIKKAIRKYL